MSGHAERGDMQITLHIWRQDGPTQAGEFVTYNMDGVSPEMSFLELLDELNEQLTHEGREPVAFDHDCREGICGSCGVVINGNAHGPDRETATCQLHMRRFKDGDTLTLEPFRAKAFPIVRDLVVDRSPFDRIIAAGGFVSVPTGAPGDANSTLVPKNDAELAMDAAACIGCAACVAACPNAAAMLFVGAKVSQLALLPQGKLERKQRVLSMVAAMDQEPFGNCSNVYECEAACPKGISVANIARLNREYIAASICAD